MKFTELNLSTELLDALMYMGFENATPIQEQAIPAILDGKDMIACAQTGTGKTAAFILPILNKMVGKTEAYTDTLIIVPTRELAVQIEQQIQGLSYFISVSSKAIYGGGSGKDFEEEKQALTTGTDIIVATPGKLLSHLKLGYVKFNSVKHLILDEADRMLDMGFHDDLQNIIKHLPEKRQNLLFSATMAGEIRKLARNMLHEPLEINLALSKPAEGVDQKVFLTHDEQKNPLLNHLLSERKHFERIILFTSTKSKVNDIVRYIQRKGFKVSGISSDLEQEQREETLRGFRSGRIPVLVATDVMSRGIDIKEINMVINYDVPGDAEDYVHRVGRTARANTTGEAVTFINERDMQRFKRIEDLIGSTVPRMELPAELGQGPEWKVNSSNNRNHNKKRNFKRKKPNNKPNNNQNPPS
jgi:superfamily II DNA/RNA helicase